MYLCCVCSLNVVKFFKSQSKHGHVDHSHMSQPLCYENVVYSYVVELRFSNTVYHGKNVMYFHTVCNRGV